MPTLEQCKNLAKWGLPQQLKEGDVHYEQDRKGQWSVYAYYGHGTLMHKWYRIPDLKVLMDFAKTLSLTWLVKPSPDGWRVTRAAEGVCKLSSWTDPSLFDVVYELIEREGGR